MMVLEALVLQAELSPTNSSGMADSYTAPKANGEASLAQDPCYEPSQITSPLPRAKGWRQASRHQRAQSIQNWGPSQCPSPCATPPVKGSSDLSAPNSSHPRAGFCVPETASKDKNYPKGEQHPPGQIFPYQHTQPGGKQEHQSHYARARQLQYLHRTMLLPRMPLHPKHLHM